MTTAALAATALAATAGALCTRLVAIWPDVVAARPWWSSPSTHGIDSLVAAPLLAIGVALATWWSVSLLLITASLVAERAGMPSTALLRCVHTVAPRTLRRLAVTGLGAGLTFSTLPAHAAQEPPDLGWTTTQQATEATPEHPHALPPTVPQTTLPLPVVPQVTAPQATDPTTHLVPVDPTSLGAPPPSTEESDLVGARPDLAPGVVVVATGDTLWDLAAATLPPDATNAQIATSWHAWYDLNAAVIGADPDLLHPGQLLQVPPASSLT